MAKVVFTYGSFDCLGPAHSHLVNEMRKAALPDNHVFAIVPDDYTVFKSSACFPIQALELRLENLRYLIPDKSVKSCRSFEGESLLADLVKMAAKAGHKPVLVAYADEVSTVPGLDKLKKSGVLVKVIKKYGAR